MALDPDRPSCDRPRRHFRRPPPPTLRRRVILCISPTLDSAAGVPCRCKEGESPGARPRDTDAARPRADPQKSAGAPRPTSRSFTHGVNLYVDAEAEVLERAYVCRMWWPVSLHHGE